MINRFKKYLSEAEIIDLDGFRRKKERKQFGNREIKLWIYDKINKKIISFGMPGYGSAKFNWYGSYNEYINATTIEYSGPANFIKIPEELKIALKNHFDNNLKIVPLSESLSAYSDIGHNRGDDMWLWLNNKLHIKKDDGKVHEEIWTQNEVTNHFRGRYDKYRNIVTILFPYYNMGVKRVPAELLNALNKQYTNNPKYLLFKWTNL